MRQKDYQAIEKEEELPQAHQATEGKAARSLRRPSRYRLSHQRPHGTAITPRGS